jgi:hypothetical protein
VKNKVPLPLSTSPPPMEFIHTSVGSSASAVFLTVRNSKGIQLPARRDTNLLLPRAFHITVSCILEETMPISSLTITDILINGLCNTLKLAIFSMHVIYVLRLINILKYEIFFRNRKFAVIFWLHFYREAMLPPHPCTLNPCGGDDYDDLHFHDFCKCHQKICVRTSKSTLVRMNLKCAAY